jgi:hypothetical protein
VAAAEAEGVLRTAVKAALDGDMRAIEIVLARVWPVRKGRPLRLRLPPIAAAADVARALSELVQAVAAGDVTPEEAATVAGLLEAKRRAIETADLEARINQLERHLKR